MSNPFQFCANVSRLDPVYVRGQADWAARPGSAAAEFQKILAHSNIVWNCGAEALAHRGVARDWRLGGQSSQGAARMPMLLACERPRALIGPAPAGGGGEVLYGAPRDYFLILFSAF
jgi:hypothetical protein